MLKQIEDILIVNVAEDAYRFSLVTNKELTNHYGKLEWMGRDYGTHHSIEIPNIENWELIGLSHLLTSEQKEMVIEKCYEGYRNYVPNGNFYLGLDDSYQSWLEANGIEKNMVLLKLKK